MISNICLVAPSAVKATVTGISPNFDETELAKQIVATQDTLIPKIVGSTIYDKLRNHVYNYITSSTPIPAPYDSLYNNEYFIKSICWAVAVELNLFNRASIDNAGNVVKTDQDYTAAQVNDVEHLNRALQNKAKEYRRLFEQWWADNLTNFADYNTVTTLNKRSVPPLIDCGILFG